MLISDPKELLLRVQSKSAYIGSIVVRIPESIKVGRWKVNLVDLIISIREVRDLIGPEDLMPGLFHRWGLDEWKGAERIMLPYWKERTSCQSASMATSEQDCSACARYGRVLKTWHRISFVQHTWKDAAETPEFISHTSCILFTVDIWDQSIQQSDCRASLRCSIAISIDQQMAWAVRFAKMGVMSGHLFFGPPRLFTHRSPLQPCGFLE